MSGLAAIMRRQTLSVTACASSSSAVLVDRQDLAVAHDEGAIDHHRMDEAGMAVMDEVRDEPHDRAAWPAR